MHMPWAIVLVLVVAFSPAVADEPKLVKVDNPEFKSWSKFKVGTSVTHVSKTETGGVKSSTTMTTKLAEVTADKCVLETETVVVTMGQEFKAPADKRDVPKTIEVPAAMAKQPESGKPDGASEEGTETIKVGGTEVKTKWFKFKTKTPGEGDVEGQVWFSDDVPGGMVKTTGKSDKFDVKVEMTVFTKK